MPDPATFDPIVATAIETISVPRERPADSFVLHAPLEVAARIGLIDHLAAGDRPAALAQLEHITERYAASGPPAAGEPPEVPAARDVVDSLAAAGHVPIGLHLVRRVADGRLPITLLRGPLRELGRAPDLRLRWFRAPTAPATVDAGGDLADRLRTVPHLGRPGSDFIAPLMLQVESSGAAATAIGPSLTDDPGPVARTLLRAAAWSMLHDDPDQAPYGWSHCLTLPQGVMALVDQGVPAPTAIAVAGTHVVGFRAAHGQVELGSLADDDAEPDDADIDAATTAAAHHHDAHLAKYVLACRHAAEDDPAWRGSYHRAAAHLVRWWQAHP